MYEHKLHTSPNYRRRLRTAKTKFSVFSPEGQKVERKRHKRLREEIVKQGEEGNKKEETRIFVLEENRTKDREETNA